MNDPLVIGAGITIKTFKVWILTGSCLLKIIVARFINILGYGCICLIDLPCNLLTNAILSLEFENCFVIHKKP